MNPADTIDEAHESQQSERCAPRGANHEELRDYLEASTEFHQPLGENCSATLLTAANRNLLAYT